MTVVSIAKARDTLTRLIQKAESGEPVHITRRGKPVAVLVSEEDYAKMQPPTEARQSLFEWLAEWRAGMIRDGIPFPTDEEIERWQDRSGPDRPDIDFT
jgi:prevent-host-death family protein